MKRIFTLSTIFCISLLLLATPVLAASDAQNSLEKTINSVLDELKKPGIKDPNARVAILANVEKIILTLFDFNELSTRTVGPSWKNFSADQKTQFTNAFTTLLRETYLEKLNGYNGEQVSYIGETASSAGDKIEIQTSVLIQGKPVSVSYRMLKKQQWVVYDIIIEGVSMVQNYRTQFQEMLTRGDIDGLVKQVGVKAEESRTRNRKSQTGS